MPIDGESQQHIVGLSAEDSKVAGEQEQHSAGDCARAHVNRAAVLGVDAVDRFVSLGTCIEVPDHGAIGGRIRSLVSVSRSPKDDAGNHGGSGGLRIEAGYSARPAA